MEGYVKLHMFTNESKTETQVMFPLMKEFSFVKWSIHESLDKVIGEPNPINIGIVEVTEDEGFDTPIFYIPDVISVSISLMRGVKSYPIVKKEISLEDGEKITVGEVLRTADELFDMVVSPSNKKYDPKNELIYRKISGHEGFKRHELVEKFEFMNLTLRELFHTKTYFSGVYLRGNILHIILKE
jgi:hypothetical protein